MDVEHIKWFATLGVGGALAFVMFLIYRKDALGVVTNLKSERDLLLEALRGNTAALTNIQSTLANNTHTLEVLIGNCRAVATLGGLHEHDRPTRRRHGSEGESGGDTSH